ncbi:MAG: indolepyruvate oxidoreductase subunit beta family protein [Sulfurifustis sp.]
MSVPRPVSILIGALGGEGGGVLSRWLVDAARFGGYPAQSTSIPGVAQRTGATTYYVEILPVTHAQLGTRDIVLALSPVPGHVDLFIASELLEAARAASAGAIGPARTTVIASTHRAYTVIEKSAMSDGRFDDAAIRSALGKCARELMLFDMDAAARAARTVLSAVMLGAIAASGRLPLKRAAFEEAIRASGKNTEANLKGFDAGFAAIAYGPRVDAGTERVAGLSRRRVRGAVRAAIENLRGRFPQTVLPLIEEGYLRQLDYQDAKYADLYASRLERVMRAERAFSGTATDFPVTQAVARFLALWMSYEDVIRVADLKSRATRRERIRGEARAAPGDLVKIVEFLKPGIEEWCAVLPPGLARRLRRFAERRGNASRFNVGLRINTTSLHGFLLLRGLASLRRLRRYTARYEEEQRLIERWLGAIVDALEPHPPLALELALCGRLIKGYGDTHARGKANFLRILDDLLASTALVSDEARVDAVREAREAALADPDGKKLDMALRAHGIAPRPVKTQPIVWHKRPTAAR